MFGRQCIFARIKQMVRSISRNRIFFTVSSSLRTNASGTYLGERYFYPRASYLSPLNFSIEPHVEALSKFLSSIIYTTIRERKTQIPQIFPSNVSLIYLLYIVNLETIHRPLEILQKCSVMRGSKTDKRDSLPQSRIVQTLHTPALISTVLVYSKTMMQLRQSAFACIPRLYLRSTVRESKATAAPAKHIRIRREARYILLS